MKSLRILFLFLLGSFCTQAQTDGKYLQYSGKYTVANGPFNTIKIYEKDGKFMGEAVGQGSSELKSTEKNHEFSLVDYPGGSLSFTQNEDNITNALILMIDGNEIRADREMPNLSEYVGNYKMSSDMVAEMKISLKDGKLMVTTAEYGSSDLASKGMVDRFVENGYHSDITFGRNADDEVVSIKVELPSQGISMEGVKEMAAAASSDLSQYVGSYNLADYGVKLKIDVIDGKLHLNSPQGESNLEPKDQVHTFEVPGMDVVLEFKMAGNGTVSELIVDYQGTLMAATPE